MLAERFLRDAKAIASDSIGNQIAGRGITAAYYALFHSFCEAGVDLLLAPHPFTRKRVRRIFSHEELGKVARTLQSADESRDPKKLEG